MKTCPACKARALIVVDSRHDDTGCRRRYECRECGERISSVERWFREVEHSPKTRPGLTSVSNRALIDELSNRMGVRL